MKIFGKQNIIKKIAISILIVLSVQLITVKPVRAASDDLGFGGILITPVLELTNALGDGIIAIIQSTIMGQGTSIVYTDTEYDFWEELWAGLKESFLVSITGPFGALYSTIKNGAMAVEGMQNFVGSGFDDSYDMGEEYVKLDNNGDLVSGVYYSKDVLPETFWLPLYSISPEEIFKGTILLFDVDFFNPTRIHPKYNNDGEFQYYYYIDGKDEIITSKDNTALQLRNTVSKWYKAIRNIALVLMMSVLLYVAIRMMLSSLASDKAKYKQMLWDWFIGMCLLFLMHYIMAGSVMLVKLFTRTINSGMGSQQYQMVYFENDENNKLKKLVEELDMSDLYLNSKNVIAWPTNLMGKVRIASQIYMGTARYIGYSICFLVLVFYTVMFTFTYLRRVVYLAFLTMIAPFVALTYPIDKLNDGQAQGFNKWLKEYIYNLLLQPLHLLIYTMLVTSVFEFAGKNIIYMLVAIGFMLPAEKVLRSLFGFEKASTPPSFAGAAASAGIISSTMQKMLRQVPNKSNNQKKMPEGKDNGKALEDGKGNVKFSDNDFDSSQVMADKYGLKNEKDNGDRTTDRNSNNKGKRNNNEDPDNLGYDMDGNLLGFGQQYDEDGYEMFDKQNRMDELGEELDQYSNEDIYMNPDLQAKQEEYNRLANEKELIDRQRQEQQEATVDNNEENDVRNTNNNENSDKEPENLGYDEYGNPLGFGQQYEEERPQRLTPKNPKKMSKLKANMKKFNNSKVGRGLRAGGKVLGRAAGNIAIKGARTLPKVAGAAFVGGVAGTIGIAAGLASNDFKNVATYGIGGATAGAVAGSRLGSLGMSAASSTVSAVQNTANEVSREYLGKDEYERRQQEKLKREWKRQHKREMEQYVDANVAREMYQRGGEVDTYMNAGISDMRSMAAMHKLIEQGIADDAQHAAAIHKFAQKTGDTTNMKDKDRNEWKQTFTRQLKEKSGTTEEKAKTASDNLMKQIDKYNKIKKKI